MGYFPRHALHNSRGRSIHTSALDDIQGQNCRRIKHPDDVHPNARSNPYGHLHRHPSRDKLVQLDNLCGCWNHARLPSRHVHLLESPSEETGYR